MNAYSSFYSLVWLTLLGVAIAWLAWHAWMPTALPRAGAREPACEVCRRSVAEAPGLCCPGCGSDLRISGIITPAIEVRRRGTLSSAMGSLALLWLIVYVSGVRTFAAWMGGGTWDDQDVLTEVSVIAGWLSIGAGIAIALVRRRWRLAGRGRVRPVLRAGVVAGTPCAPYTGKGGRSRAVAPIVTWLLLWFGVGGLVVGPLITRALPIASWGLRHPLGMDISVAVVVLAWGVLGAMLGRVFFRMRLRSSSVAGDNGGT